MSRTSQYTDPGFLAKLANLELVARCCVEGLCGGRHPSPFHGFSVEYSDHRAYRPGDEPRYLDWKAFGRSDRLYIKQFRHETNTTMHILLDSSASMAFASGAVSKFRYGCFLSAAIAYMALGQNDSTGLTIFSDTFNSRIPASSRKSHLNLLYRTLEHGAPRGRTDLARILHLFSETTSRRGLAIIISDFLDCGTDFKKSLAHLKHCGHDVILMHVLDDAELSFNYNGPLEVEDMESHRVIKISAGGVRSKYIKRAEEYISELRNFCGNNEIDHELINTADPVDNAMISYLRRRKHLF